MSIVVAFVVPAVFTTAFALTRFIPFIHSGMAIYALPSAADTSVQESTAITVNHFLQNILLHANQSGVTALVASVPVDVSEAVASSTLPATVSLAASMSDIDDK